MCMVGVAAPWICDVPGCNIAQSMSVGVRNIIKPRSLWVPLCSFSDYTYPIQWSRSTAFSSRLNRMEQLISQYARGFIIIFPLNGYYNRNKFFSWSNTGSLGLRRDALQFKLSVSPLLKVASEFRISLLNVLQPKYLLRYESANVFLDTSLTGSNSSPSSRSDADDCNQLLTKAKKNEELTTVNDSRWSPNNAIRPKATDVTNIIKSKQPRAKRLCTATTRRWR